MLLSPLFSHLILVTAIVTPVIAQSLPPCAAQCFEAAVSQQEACSMTDTSCICADAALSQAIQGCVVGACTLKQSLAAINATNAMCDIPIKDRTSALIITNALFTVLALLALIIRIFVSVQQRIFGPDDYCAVMAYAFAAPVAFGQLACGVLGFGKDTWAVPTENIYLIMKIVYFNQLSYFVSSAFSKLCFLLMFLRIFPSERTRRFSQAGIVASILFPIAFGLPMTFACKPISAVWTSWDMETPYDHCINQPVFWFCAAGYNIALDIYIVTIPIPNLLKLSLSTRKRLMLVAIFSTGIITIIVSIARLWALAQYGGSTNPIYDNMLSGIFSPLELNVGIVCMCMPAFRRFVSRLLPSCFGSTHDSYTPEYRRCEQDDLDEVNPSNNQKKKKKKIKHNNTLGGSLFQDTIMDTVNTQTEGTKEEDGEVQLTELRESNGPGPTDVVDPASRRRAEGLLKAKYRNT